ncbi:MAG: hypothetical protein K6C96_02895 [Butyrivibrio sp.]|nr:hypothetical protein [Butyrivibrio sp.]
MEQIILGQGLLIVCCIFYLIWWGVAFHPSHGDSHTSGIDGILLLATAIFGLAGLAVNMLGIVKIPPKEELISGIVIIIAGVVTYVVLLLGSRIILNRQVTSELFLIIGWTMLEVASINRSFAWEMVTANQVVVLLVIVAAAAILSLYFYLQYYRVKPMVGYIYGMIPLIMVAVSMGVFEYLIYVGREFTK